MARILFNISLIAFDALARCATSSRAARYFIMSLVIAPACFIRSRVPVGLVNNWRKSAVQCYEERLVPGLMLSPPFHKQELIIQYKSL